MTSDYILVERFVESVIPGAGFSVAAYTPGVPRDIRSLTLGSDAKLDAYSVTLVRHPETGKKMVVFGRVERSSQSDEFGRPYTHQQYAFFDLQDYHMLHDNLLFTAQQLTPIDNYSEVKIWKDAFIWDPQKIPLLETWLDRRIEEFEGEFSSIQALVRFLAQAKTVIIRGFPPDAERRVRLMELLRLLFPPGCRPQISFTTSYSLSGMEQISIHFDATLPGYPVVDWQRAESNAQRREQSSAAQYARWYADIIGFLLRNHRQEMWYWLSTIAETIEMGRPDTAESLVNALISALPADVAEASGVVPEDYVLHRYRKVGDLAGLAAHIDSLEKTKFLFASLLEASPTLEDLAQMWEREVNVRLALKRHWRQAHDLLDDHLTRTPRRPEDTARAFAKVWDELGKDMGMAYPVLQRLTSYGASECFTENVCDALAKEARTQPDRVASLVEPLLQDYERLLPLHAVPLARVFLSLRQSGKASELLTWTLLRHWKTREVRQSVWTFAATYPSLQSSMADALVSRLNTDYPDPLGRIQGYRALAQWFGEGTQQRRFMQEAEAILLAETKKALNNLPTDTVQAQKYLARLSEEAGYKEVFPHAIKELVDTWSRENLDWLYGALGYSKWQAGVLQQEMDNRWGVEYHAAQLLASYRELERIDGNWPQRLKHIDRTYLIQNSIKTLQSLAPEKLERSPSTERVGSGQKSRGSGRQSGSGRQPGSDTGWVHELMKPLAILACVLLLFLCGFLVWTILHDRDGEPEPTTDVIVTEAIETEAIEPETSVIAPTVPPPGPLPEEERTPESEGAPEAEALQAPSVESEVQSPFRLVASPYSNLVDNGGRIAWNLPEWGAAYSPSGIYAYGLVDSSPQEVPLPPSGTCKEALAVGWIGPNVVWGCKIGQLGIWFPPLGSPVTTTLAFSLTAMYPANFGQSVLLSDSQGQLYEWPGWGEPTSEGWPRLETQEQSIALCHLPDSKSVLYVSTSGRVVMKSGQQGSDPTHLNLPAPAVAAAWTPDCTRLAAIDGNGAVYVWQVDPLSGVPGESVQVPSQDWGSAQSIAWAADNVKLAIGTTQGQVLVWNMGSPGALDSYHLPADSATPVLSVGWSRDSGALGALDGNGQIYKAYLP